MNRIVHAEKVQTMLYHRDHTVHAHIVGSGVISDKKGKELLNKKKVSEQNCTVKHDIPTFNPQSKKKLN